LQSTGTSVKVVLVGQALAWPTKTTSVEVEHVG
jgi:hypothetical protein